MIMGKRRELDDNYIIARYEKWVSCSCIGRELDASGPTIQKRLQERGVRIKTQKEYCQEKVRRGLHITKKL